MLVNPNGVSSIEFSITIGVFFFVVFMIFELCRLAVISAYWDLAIAESVRIVKNQQAPNNDYATLFKKTLLEQRQSLESATIGLLAEHRNSLEVEVKYVDSVEHLANQNFIQSEVTQNKQTSTSIGRNAALALYILKYNYSPIVPLPFLPTSWTNHLLERKIVMVQEYERSKFDYTN
ncbi:pilus assembly protein [Lonepinella koalarum]|nr:TadE/TadG family type IV pilus assembly protein [Lonepinella koalarum]MDH2927795.1 hypothetical protein [Lonepinella koalarum]TFJ90409.1 pilus assembly protein [Lonepinella koalarum]TYG35106.1 pilus assembly protein [Lonepinella koalarum]